MQSQAASCTPIYKLIREHLQTEFSMINVIVTLSSDPPPLNVILGTNFAFALMSLSVWRCSLINKFIHTATNKCSK